MADSTGEEGRFVMSDAICESRWNPMPTAPRNRDLEIVVADGNKTFLLPFPCRINDSGDWINADLGTRIRIQPQVWRTWDGF